MILHPSDDWAYDRPLTPRATRKLTSELAPGAWMKCRVNSAAITQLSIHRALFVKVTENSLQGPDMLILYFTSQNAHSPKPAGHSTHLA